MMLESSFFESHLLPGKKIQAHEGERVQDNNKILSLFKKKREKKIQTNQHIKNIPYLSSRSSVSAHWL